MTIVCDGCRVPFTPSGKQKTCCSKSCAMRVAVRIGRVKKMIPENIARQIIAAYQSGKSMREAGEMYGHGRGGARSILVRAGIRRRSFSECRKGYKASDETRRRISANHHDVSGKNNPMYGKAPGHGQWVYVPHLKAKVRSTWEAKIANTLLQLGVEHQYEPTRLHLHDLTYTPDFYLPSHNVYLEVKGWANPRFRQMFPRLKYELPHIDIILVDKFLYEMVIDRPDMLLLAVALYKVGQNESLFGKKLYNFTYVS